MVTPHATSYLEVESIHTCVLVSAKLVTISNCDGHEHRVRDRSETSECSTASLKFSNDDMTMHVPGMLIIEANNLAGAFCASSGVKGPSFGSEMRRTAMSFQRRTVTGLQDDSVGTDK